VTGPGTSTGVRIGGAKRQRGRYVLGDRLGKGGMAEVFAGQALGSHGFAKPVAIKRILPRHANDLAYVDRLIDEANLLVAMQHGNVVSVLDLVREGDDVFLVMEYVDGPSLRQLLHPRRPAPVSLGVATYVAHAAATGLEFAHARPGGAIIHADISPSNLLLTTSGEVKVADFGIARREGVGTVGVVEGKWAYMAPEQARGETLDVRADVFALGVVLYEMLTGAHPLVGAGARRQGSAGRDDDSARAVAPPRSLRPELPPALDALCMRAIAHDPRDRIPTMQHLADALTELRFANGWRDGAPELAQVIRDARGGVRAVGSAPGIPRPAAAAEPVTIITRSLLGPSESASAPGAAGSGDGAVVGPAGAPTVATVPSRPLARAEAMLAAGTDRHGGTVAPVQARGRGRRTVALIAAASLVGFAVIAIVTWRLLIPDAGVVAPVTPVQASLPPADPEPTAAAEVVRAPVPAPAPVAAPVERGPVHAASAPAERKASRARKKAPVREPEPEPAAAKDVAPGTLRVSAVPWAYVTVDGKTHETPVRKLELAPGTYAVKLHSPDNGARRTLKVTIKSGATETLTVDMGDSP
jgi:tRNA A-37 threonylcarbamoyl transferase component Bud32